MSTQAAALASPGYKIDAQHESISHALDRGYSIASTASVVERSLSADEYSGVQGCTKCCVKAENGNSGSPLRTASQVGKQLTTWAQQGVETLSLLASGRGQESSSPIDPINKQGRRTRQSWKLCLDDDASEPVNAMSSAASVQSDTALMPAQRLEEHMTELFNLQDLNGNGVLEETELIKLNEKIAMLHYGKNIDRQVVKDKYSEIFRTQLSANGEPVTYATFRTYMFEVLNAMDSDLPSQEMILEGFIAEAKEGRAAFRITSLASATDAPWLPSMYSDGYGGRAIPGVNRNPSRGLGSSLESLPPAVMPAVQEDLYEDQSTPSHAAMLHAS